MDNSFDKTWEKIYANGEQLNRYPFDAVVSFIFNHKPNIPNKEIHLLEVGCGAGNNLWFAAREGLNVTGIDGSESAILFAKKRFFSDNLDGNLVTGNFKNLPFSDNSYHLVIDRCAITHTNSEGMRAAIEEIHRVLALNGHFFFSTFCDSHSSATSGQYDPETKTVGQITAGSLVGVGQVNFLSLNDIRNLFPSTLWEIISQKRVESIEFASSDRMIDSEWRVIVKKLRNKTI